MVRVERLLSYDQLLESEKVQQAIWGEGVVPALILRAIQDSGGLVLGAYDDDGKMIGTLVGFLGSKDGKLLHYSHLCGVVEGKRFQEVGYMLKLAQRDYAISQGLDLVVWTFDPLQGANAYFNLTKLGAVCRKYFRNYYGEMRDRINYGIESDRFLAEWWVKSERVKQRIRGVRPKTSVEELLDEGACLVNRTYGYGEGLLRNDDYNLNLEEEQLLLEIPSDINRLKSKDVGLAREWRRVTRDVFEAYFSKGYVASELLSEVKKGVRRNFYVLKKWDRVANELSQG